LASALARVAGIGVEQSRAYRQDARSAAVIQHAPAPQRLALRRDPAQTHARGRVRASTERKPRVQPHHLPRQARRFMPTGDDPKRRRDLHRRKLRLRQAHPILLGHRSDAQQLATGKKILRLQQPRGLARGGLFVEQRGHARTAPALARRRHAWLAKKRLLGRRLGVGVLHADRQGAQRLQRLAHGLHRAFNAQETQLEHARRHFLRRASHSSR
jgi:hypothetical protein